ncbi:hypothetical protein [Halomonas nitroreducens]|uniref:Uncharacterized protein n=1 Tax=Halomonas nitroreducens TaxID=447425 RepID=A0A3S0HN21_9GAMM|nr:hypothetical protein EKG36_16635 [Halomonas nitroreducens]
MGQQLIAFGIECLKTQGVDLVFTYGDPGVYAKVGFCPIGEACVKAPLTLSHPEGWLGQSLTGDTIEPVPGATRCVEALNKSHYW